MSTVSKPYRPPVSLLWWARKPSYLLFVLRELSAIFVAWFVVYLLMLVWAVTSGPAAYQDFLDLSASPGMVVVNIVAAAFILLHAVTWFLLAPRAIVLRGVPPVAVLAAHYAAWLVLSALLAWLVLR